MHRTRGAARWRIGVGALIAGLAIGPAPGNDALAQALPFPSRPIRIIVPYPPGGLGDIFPRGLAAAIAEPLGQQIVIENRPGGTQIIGAQIVQIPETFVLARAEATFRVFMGSLLGVLVAVALTMNGVLWWMFIRPITKISALADRISLGEVDAPDFGARGRDEIGMLASALSRMRRSLVQAIHMLEH